ncbi:MAG: bifunctional hydroxymethylpyrimidine kinase/phosphomethylpyrimidine kinase [bacterium]
MPFERVLTVAGSDSGGGAGIQADLKTITVLGGFGMSAITALTAQNTREVTGVHAVPPEFVLRQIEAVASDIGVDAAKTGMLANREIVEVVAEAVRRFAIRPLVVDPVLVSKGGHSLLSEDARESLVRLLFPCADLVTPNLPEAELLSGRSVESEDRRRDAARALAGLGAKAVLLKGGHGQGSEAADLLFDGTGFTVFSAPRIDTANTHGTGCTYSAAIATFLARDTDLAKAIEKAKAFITGAIRFSLAIGGGHGPTNPYSAAFRDAERYQVLALLEKVGREVQKHTALGRLAPEVQSNLGFALPLAASPDEVAAFPGRLVRLPEGLAPVRAPAFGASRHIASVILAAMRIHPELRSAMNIRFSEEVLARAGGHGFRIAFFDRAREPEEVKRREGSTLEWGTLQALREAPSRPDLICDRGEAGKEPMIRLLGTDPEDVFRKLVLLV